MKFFYNSTHGMRRELPGEEVQRIRDYLALRWDSFGGGKGELHDVLLEYRREDGDRLMINQLEPIFTYVATNGSLWPVEAEAVA